MSTQRTILGRIKHDIPAAEMNQHDSYLYAVSRAVGESISLARRRDDTTTEELPIITVSANDGSWLVTFDALADLSDDERSAAGDAVAKAFEATQWHREAICLLVQPGDSLEEKPLKYLAEHRDALGEALTAYIDDVSAGRCPTATLAAHLRKLGTKGAEYAEAIETNEQAQADPLRVWFNPAQPGLSSYPSFFARAIWHDVIQPRAALEARAADNPGALTLAVWPTFESYALGKGRQIKEDSGQLQLLNADGAPIATAHVTGATAARIIQSGPDFFANYPAMVLIDYLVEQCAYRRFTEVPDHTVFLFDGGVAELAETLGITSSTQRKQLRNALIAGDTIRTKWPGGTHQTGLWQYNETRTGAGAQRSHIDIRLGPHLAPMYVYNLPDTNRILVPRVDIDDVSGIAGTQSQGAIAAAKWGVVMMMIETKARRVELATFGGVALVRRDWQRLASMVGASLPTIMKAHDEAWLVNRGEWPEFLEIKQGRYHLANNYKYQDARRFITSIAGKTKGAVKGGENSHKPTSKRHR